MCAAHTFFYLRTHYCASYCANLRRIRYVNCDITRRSICVNLSNVARGARAIKHKSEGNVFTFHRDEICAEECAFFLTPFGQFCDWNIVVSPRVSGVTSSSVCRKESFWAARDRKDSRTKDFPKKQGINARAAAFTVKAFVRFQVPVFYALLRNPRDQIDTLIPQWRKWWNQINEAPPMRERPRQTSRFRV